MRTRRMGIATLAVFGALTVVPPRVVQDTDHDIAKQRINAPVEQAKQRINRPVPTEVAKQRINGITSPVEQAKQRINKPVGQV